VFDGVCNIGSANGEADNCPNISNNDQANNDGDADGDLCDGDDDNDGCADEDDDDQFEDGPDTDSDGTDDDCDGDDDNDAVLDGDDSDPLNNFVCSDTDGDTCDDCTSGSYDAFDDGTDNDSDGWCNDGDPYPDCSYNNANDPSVYPEEINVNPYDECNICHGDGFADICVGSDDCDNMACDGVCGQEAFIDDCDICGNGCYEQNCTDWPLEDYHCEGAPHDLVYNISTISSFYHIFETNDMYGEPLKNMIK
jgi:hypothetical protein